MKTKLLALLLLAASSTFAGVFVGIRFGAPAYAYPAYGYYVPAAPPPAPVVYAPACPGPGYAWVTGYWYPVGVRWYWHGGYWARRPFAGAYWVAPRYYGHRYYAGYWRR